MASLIPSVYASRTSPGNSTIEDWPYWNCGNPDHGAVRLQAQHLLAAQNHRRLMTRIHERQRTAVGIVSPT
jgi:hypothetical protein